MGLTVLAVVAAALLTSAAAQAGDRDSGGPPAQPPPVQNLASFKQSPGQTNATFVPVVPCRIVDTRVAGGKLGKNAQRSFVVTGATGFAAQGGKSTGCAIPAAAQAVSMNVTALKPKKNGSLRAWQSGVGEPTATALTYSKKQSTTSGSTVGLATGQAKPLTVRNHGGATNLTIDVTGYYLPQIHGMVSPGGDIYSGSSRIVSATNPSTGVYVVTFDSSVMYCTPLVDTYNAGTGIYGAAYAFSNNTATVFTWYLDDAGKEVLFNYYFYIAMLC
jgi:hypothetical protein